MSDETASPDFSKPNTFQPTEFKSYQTGEIWTRPEPVKFVNIKVGKSNYHIRLVNQVLHSMYPHNNKTDMDSYDDYTQKAVRRFQQDIGTDITGILTQEEVAILADKSGTFRLV